MSARVLIAALLVVCALPAPSRAADHLRPAVDSVGMTVSDMDRAVAFYTSVLTFEKVSDDEIQGREYELLTASSGPAHGSSGCASAATRSS